MCVAASGGVKRLWIYQLPSEGQKKRLPDPTFSLSLSHTHTHHASRLLIFSPPFLCLSSSRYLFFGRLLCYFSSIHPFIPPSLCSFLDGRPVKYPSSFSSLLTPISPFIILLLRFWELRSHWHSQQVTDAEKERHREKERGEEERGRGEA